MNRALTLVLVLLAALSLTAAITLRSCLPSRFSSGLLDGFDPSTVTTVRLRSGGEVIELHRADRGWKLNAGEFRDRADVPVVAGMLQVLAELSTFDRIPASEIRSRDDLSEYGLRSPKRWIEIEGTGRILLGKEAAIEGRVYARRDDSQDVHVIEDAVAEFVDMGVDRLRDRLLTDAGPPQVDRFVIRTGEGELEVAREGEGWRIRKPLADAADEEAVAAFLGRLLGVRIESFEGDDKGDLGRLGIQEGRDEISLYIEGKERPAVVRFGNPLPDHPESLHAQLTARDCVVRLPATSSELVRIGQNELRDKRVLPLNLDMVDIVRVTAGNATVTIARQDEGWAVEGDQREVNPQSMQHVVDALADARALGFVASAEPPPVPPELQITFHAALSENSAEAPAGEQLVGGLTLWPEANGERLAKVEGRSGLLRVPSDLAAILPSDADAWTKPAPP